MKLLVENWPLLVACFAVIAVAAGAIYKFTKLPKDAQLQKVQEWLLWAVAQAEKVLGSGTGQLKLRYVYNLFVERFPEIAYFITFDQFSSMVDKALEKFNNMLASNKKLEAYINKGE